MYWEIVLGSAVLSAIISGAIGIYTSGKKNKLEYITKERSKWRMEIRKCVENLRGASYKKTVGICDTLAARINAFGRRESRRFSDDAHIWEVIDEIESRKCEKKQLRQLQSILSEYLSLLLKWDWERAKKEVLGDKLRWMEYGLWVLSVIIYGLGMLYNTYTYMLSLSNEKNSTTPVMEYEEKILGEYGALLFVVLLEILLVIGILYIEKEIETMLFSIFERRISDEKKKREKLMIIISCVLYVVFLIVIFGIYGAIMCPVTNVLVQKHTDYLSLLQFVALLYGMVAFFARIIWVLVLYVKTYKYECAVGKAREEYLGMTKQK